MIVYLANPCKSNEGLPVLLREFSKIDKTIKIQKPVALKQNQKPSSLLIYHPYLITKYNVMQFLKGICSQYHTP